MTQYGRLAKGGQLDFESKSSSSHPQKGKKNSNSTIMVNWQILPNHSLPRTKKPYPVVQRAQLLIEPFKRVSNQDELAGELDEALEFVASGHFHRLAKQRQLFLVPSSSSPKGATSATANTGPTNAKINYTNQAQDRHYLGELTPEAGAASLVRQQLTSGGAGLAPEMAPTPARRPQSVQQFAQYNQSALAALADKENQDPASGCLLTTSGQQQHVPTPAAATAAGRTTWAGGNNRRQLDLLEQLDLSCPIALMNKRQLVKALNLTFLNEIKANLVKGLHEFTDCAYTKHESRETILSLLAYVKFQLNKFVRLIYRLVSSLHRFIFIFVFIVTRPRVNKPKRPPELTLPVSLTH